MSTENEGRSAREFWVTVNAVAPNIDKNIYGYHTKEKAEKAVEARSDKPGWGNRLAVVHVREVLPGEPAGSARTFEEWADEHSYTENCVFVRCGTTTHYLDIDAARNFWNAAREGMVPADNGPEAECLCCHRKLPVSQLIEQNCGPCWYRCAMGHVKLISEGKLVAAPAQEWVSVDERLPDVAGQYVLGSFNTTPRVTFYSGINGWMGSELGPGFCTPTHWMPLPPPPAKLLTPFKRWWNSLPTHAGSDPDTFRIIAGECVHVNTAVQVWKECEAFRSGGAT